MLEPIRFSVVAAAVAARGVNEHPVVLTDGEMAGSTMQHRCLADWAFQFLAQQCGQNRGSAHCVRGLGGASAAAAPQRTPSHARMIPNAMVGTMNLQLREAGRIKRWIA